MLLSIIIPIYNVEKYLLECLNSVAFQIDHNAELILINDGSTDSSYELAKGFIKENSRINIKLIDKINGGLSDARNVGIKVSQGEYISFLDSDDIVAVNYYSSIKNFLEKDNDIDIIEFNLFRFSDFKKYEYIIDIANYKVNDNKFYALKNIFLDATWFSCSRVFRKDLFDNLKFPNGRRFEDMATTPILYLKSKKIVSIKDPLLGYRDNPNGITRNLRKIDVKDIEANINDWIKWKKEQNDNNIDLLFGLSMLKLAIYIKWINQSIDKNNFSLTKNIRKTIISQIPLKAYLYSFKAIPYLYTPRFMCELSLSINKLRTRK